MQFRDKKVVITGAAGVYGRGLATAFANAGARLALSDIRRDALEEVKRGLRLPDSRVLLHATELTDAASIADLVTTVVRLWGAPDVVVNNAGIYPFQGLLETDAAAWDRVVWRGVAGSDSFVACYVANGRLRMALAVNRVREFLALKKLVAAGATVPDDLLADEGVDLRALANRP